MNRKKILTVLLAAVITVGATAGVVSAVRLTSTKPVMVIPVTDAQGWDSSSMDFSDMYGYVTGQGIQNIEVTDPTTVKEVMVSEGDQVKKGDVLIAYDSTQTGIALRKEKLKQESIELDIRIAKQNLAVLGAMQPYQEGGDDFPDFPEEDDPLAGLEGNVELQQNMKGEPSVDERSRGYFHSDYEMYGEPGTEKNPEVFLCGDDPENIDTLIDPDFLRMMKNQADKSADEENREYYFTIETRKDNLITGEVQKSWTFKASSLTDDFFAQLAAVQAEGGEEKNLTVSKLVMPAVWNMDFKDALPEGFLKMPEQPEKNPDSKETSSGNDEEKVKSEDTTIKTTALSTELKNQRTVSLAMVKRITPYNSLMTTSSAVAVLIDQETSADGSGDSGDDSGTVDLSGSTLYSPSAEMSAEEIASARKDENNKLADLELDLREEKIHLAEAQKKADAGRAVAAFNGVVTHVGDLKNPSSDGTPFLTLSSTGGQFIKTAIPEEEYGKVKEGDALSLMSFNTGESADAVVTSVSPYPDTSGMFDNGDGATMYPVLAEVSGGVNFSSTDTLQVTLVQESLTAGTSPDSTIADGEATVDGAADGESISADSSFGEDAATDAGELQTAEIGSEPFYLNQAFVRTDGGQPYIYARNDKGRLEKRTVTLGKYGESSWEILGGLSMDDYIAFPYGNDVKEGAKTIEGTISDLYS